MACDWLEICPWTGEDVKDAPCSTINFLTVEEMKDQVWRELSKLIEQVDSYQWVNYTQKTLLTRESF